MTDVKTGSATTGKRPSSSIRILIADDHPVVRKGLVAMLSTQPEFEIAGETSTGPETVERVIALRPDVVLLDLQLPEMDGVEVIRRLRADNPDVRVIVFTAFDTDERIVGAVQAGTRGYLLKGAAREEVFEAIRVVSAGGSLLQPVVVSKLMRHISDRPKEQPAGADDMTGREMDVLQLLAQGKTNKEIASTLAISQRTAKFHVSSILGKLGAGNRTEAVAMAAQRGLVQR